MRGHDYYTWVTSEGTVIHIYGIDDRHLLNIYNMLVKTIIFAHEMNKHKSLSSAMKLLVFSCHRHLQYIGYELFKRNPSFIEII